MPSGDQRVVWLLLAATFVVILNETIMNVALRVLMVDLHIDARAVQWLSSAFMLTTAVVIPVTGYLLQRFTTRALFITAMSLFSAGTLIAAIAPGFTVLLMARIVQACGTAIMLPLLMTTLMTVVPAASRGRTMGNVSIVISVAPAIGPTISGLILNSLSWRWMFLIVLPLALAMLAIGIRWVHNVGERTSAPIDVVSVILSAFGFGGLVYGLSQIGAGGSGGGGSGGGAGGGSAGLADQAVMWVSLGVGVVALIAFVLRQLARQRTDRALLDLRTFRAPAFSLATAMLVAGMLALFGTLVVLPIYLQQVLGLRPILTGLLLLPGGLIMGLLAPLVGRVYDRRGPRVLLVPGTIIAAVALWALTLVTDHTSPWLLLGAHVTLSVGLALVFTPLFTAGLGSVRPHLYSHASAIFSTVQQVAGAAGAALFITLMSARTTTLASDGASAGAAAAGGVRTAFTAGAVIFLLAVVGAFFMRKPVEGQDAVVRDVVVEAA